MSAAIDARSAKERAQIAADFLRKGSVSGRAFSDCLEMGDGDEVLRLLIQLAHKSPKFRAVLQKHEPHWLVPGYLSDR
jgi:hypothetical protein